MDWITLQGYTRNADSSVIDTGIYVQETVSEENLVNKEKTTHLCQKYKSGAQGWFASKMSLVVRLVTQFYERRARKYKEPFQYMEASPLTCTEAVFSDSERVFVLYLKHHMDQSDHTGRLY